MKREIIHDLKSPASTIEGYAHLLNDEVSGNLNDKQREYVDEILISCRMFANNIRCLKIINDTENGKLYIDDTKSELNSIITNSVNSYQKFIKKKNINIKIKDNNILLNKGYSLLLILLDNIILNILNNIDNTELNITSTEKNGNLIIEIQSDKPMVSNIVREAVSLLKGKILTSDNFIELSLSNKYFK